MKSIHLFGLVVIAAMIGIIFTSLGDTSKYVCFEEAKALAMEGDKSTVHVVGTLVRDAAGEPVNMVYKPEEDPDHFSFILKDEKEQIFKVVCTVPPSMTDFKRSEKVVVEGVFEDQIFVANKLLLKCPSKYEEKELKM